MRLRILNRRGDTLIEVLISMAILLTVLGGAYVLAGRNLSSFRKSQERGEAFKLVESQLEKLKQVVHSGGGSGVFAPGGPAFCLDDSTPVPARRVFSSGRPPAALEADPLDNTLYPAACLNVGGRYNLSINFDNSKSQFTARARWWRVNSNERDEVKMEYQLK